MPETRNNYQAAFADERTGFRGPITAPVHAWFTSPARSHPNAAQAKELPLHLIQLILTYVHIVLQAVTLYPTTDGSSSTMRAILRASREPRASSIT